MQKKNKENVRAYFVQRLAAFLLDVIIVGLICTVLTIPFTNDSVAKLSDQSIDIMQNYINHEISATTYMNQSIDITYQLAKLNGLSTVVTIVVYVLYFIVLQYYMKGQTLGKRILKIRVVKNDDSVLSMNDLVVRNIINNGIVFDIIIAILALVSKNIYFYGSAIVEFIQYVIIFASVLMVIIRKDGRSISDFIAGTKVISLKED
ncbi:MAG: RDD family protein [Bacilli bacterium]|nr:RDD family protein [Bacilli bacterium]